MSDVSKLIAWWNIGWSTRDASVRNVGRNLPNIGWRGFIETEAQSAVARGFRRLMLHNPFGTLPGEVMQFDQYIEAVGADLGWLTRDFGYWKRVTRGSFTADDPVEVIAYLGALDSDASFEKVRKLQTPVAAAAWIARAYSSILPLLDAGMSIAFDSLGGKNGVDIHHPAVDFVSLLQALGVRTYIEPWPGKQQLMFHVKPGIVMVDRFWKNMASRDFTWHTPVAEVKGEIVRIVKSPREDIIADTRSVLRDGHTAAVSISKLPKNITAEQLADEAEPLGPENVEEDELDEEPTAHCC